MNKYLKFILLIAIYLTPFFNYAQRQIYAVIVGVADYKYDVLNLDLNYSDDDARSFYYLLREGGVPQKNIALLTDFNATKANISDNLQYVFAKANENDEVIFYFSGHGDKGCFIPYDFNGKYSSVLENSIVKAAFKKCKAKKKICIADACFSGSIKRPSTKAAMQIYEPGEKTEVVVMMSSRDYQTSRENRTLKHGVFTFYLIQGLKGPADTNMDKIITVSEMYYYTRQKVKSKTHNEQIPIIFGNFDKNMPVLYLK